MTEIWKKVPGYDRYEVSNKERIKNIVDVNSNKIREFKDAGYKSIGVIDNEGIEKHIRFNRLVASAFIPNPEKLPLVLHNKGKSNEPENLKRGEEGEQNKNENIIRPERHNVVPIQRLDKKGNVLQTYPDRASISKWIKDNYTSKATDFSIEESVRNACRNPAKIYRGYKWKYAFEAIQGEEWKRHPNIETHEFSTEGRCFDGTKLIVGCVGDCDYIIILSNYRLNILIAQTFIPNPDNLPEVDHINEDKTDNRVCNLRWSTSLDNNKHSKDKKVYQYYVTTFIAEYESETVASKKTGVAQSSISCCTNGDRKTAGGFRWSFTKK